MKLRIVVAPTEEGGYTAHTPSLPGCRGEGGTIAETMAGFRRAIRRLAADGSGQDRVIQMHNYDIHIIWPGEPR